METAAVISDGDIQTVQLPRSCRLNAVTVTVRQEGESVVLEPLKPADWPAGFFEAIRIEDPAFERASQGTLPPIKRF
jgi:virulence-associated protein VagC